MAREVMAQAAVERATACEPAQGFPASRATRRTSCSASCRSDYRKPFDMREVIARIVDDSDFLEFQDELRPRTRSAATAGIEGQPVGIIGNNGPIDADGATKAAQFIQLCCQADMPIVFLQNTTGYMVGREAEQAGLIKHGSKMIQAVANATVPQLTIHVGASFGAGNYGMCGRGFDPRFIFAWPWHRTAVMGGEQAAKVMAIVTGAKLKTRGQAGRPGRSSRRWSSGIIARIEGEFDRALRHRPPAGRRHHRSARHPHGARPLPAICREARCAAAQAQHVRRRPAL